MNGFANAILSLLLSWIRVIISQFWKLLSSDTGEKLFSFFANNWKTMVLILCIGGVIIDLIVYFLRWRPDIVWRSRRLRKEEQWMAEEEAAAEEAPYPQQGYQWENDSGYYPDDNAVQRGTHAAGYSTAGFQPVRGVRALDVEQQRAAPYVQPAPQTNVYAPVAQNSDLAQPASPTNVYAPVNQSAPAAPSISEQEIDPVFDEDTPLSWNEGDTLLRPSSGGSYQPSPYAPPQQRPASYFRDMQAGYAPQLTPQQMYAPQVPGLEPRFPSSAPVHPGLDADSLRKNIGLSPAGSLADKQEEVYKINTNPLGNNPVQPRSKTLLSTLARRARDLIGTDDNTEKTIHDLQPTVDMNNAFHDPVYPVPLLNRKDDETSNF